jgi:threonyl-tRNA synthetase
VGRREAEEGNIALRRLGGKEQEILALDEAVAKVSAEAVPPTVS